MEKGRASVYAPCYSLYCNLEREGIFLERERKKNVSCCPCGRQNCIRSDWICIIFMFSLPSFFLSLPFLFTFSLFFSSSLLFYLSNEVKMLPPSLSLHLRLLCFYLPLLFSYSVLFLCLVRVCMCVCCVCGVHNTTTIIIIIIMYDFGVMLRETLLRVFCLYPVVVHNPFVLSLNLVWKKKWWHHTHTAPTFHTLPPFESLTILSRVRVYNYTSLNFN